MKFMKWASSPVTLLLHLIFLAWLFAKWKKDMVVIRSLQLTQKKTQSTFKTLDGVLKQTDPRTGEKSAMSHKCGELDKLVRRQCW
jgi:hypothetical protein